MRLILIKNLLLFSDLDGTLLTSEKTISPGNIAAIKRFTDEGGLFTLATGRSYNSARRYFDSVPINAPMILYNGAEIYDLKTDKVLYKKTLQPFVRDYLKEILECFPTLGTQLTSRKRTDIVNKSDHIIDHVKLENVEYNYCTVDEIEDTPYKVLFASTAEEIEKLTAFVTAQNYQNVTFVRSEEKYLEMLPLGVSKGSALLKYKEILSNENLRTAAIGDHWNDLEMLESADVSAAPANAVDGIKKQANLVLRETNNEDAASKFIEILSKGDGFVG